MPFCTNCGTQVDASAAFCYHCGSRQKAQPTGRANAGGSSAPSGQFRPTGATGPAAGSGGYTTPSADILHGVNERTASVLCYIPVFGIIPAIVFLASQKFRRNPRVRFDAFQSLYLFVAWLILSAVVPVLFFGFGFEIAKLGKLAMIVIWIVLLVRASRDQPTHIPILGDLAARSAAEQS